MPNEATDSNVELAESPATVELGIAGLRVPLHSHVACLCETEQHLDEALGFVTAGLRGSDHCVIAGDAADNQRILGSLERQGSDVASCLAAGRLSLVDRGSSAPAMLEAVTVALAAATAAGARVVRLAGIIGWDREDDAPDAELFAFEAGLNQLAARWPCVILCLHQVRSMGGLTVLHGALATHPQLLAAGGVVANPYFAPLDRQPERLAAVHAELSRRQQERLQLRQRSELLQTIFDNIPVMVSLFDPRARRQLFANREWERVTGWSVDEAQRVDILAELYPDAAERQRAERVIREGTRQWTAFQTRVRSGRVLDTLWMRSRLSDGTTIGFGLDVTERKRTEEQLRQSSEELRALSARLRAAREEESARIAREVHDEVGQMLTALRLDVAWLERLLASPAVPGREALGGKLHDMSQLLDLASDAVHRIISELRPGILDELGLEAAVEWYVGEFEKRTGISCRLVSTMAGAELGSDQATALFRILQEALTNVARHAGATAVDIRLAAEAGRVTLEIVDNGSGIPEHKINDSRSIGLVGMRERTLALGGDLVVRPNPGSGTAVEVILPR
ncbi:MAG TPA: MEDS domain-containing protein [Thermoanaerobaculia bacterium]|nr:MEDS domain-containing protein [Thermoanaerobaculia bacterium]